MALAYCACVAAGGTIESNVGGIFSSTQLIVKIKCFVPEIVPGSIMSAAVFPLSFASNWRIRIPSFFHCFVNELEEDS
jgi:hypothetical protein